MGDILTERSARLLAGQRIATEYDVHVLLSGLVERAGSQKAVADSLGVSRAYLSDVLLGRRPISAELAGRMGWKKIELFVQKK